MAQNLAQCIEAINTMDPLPDFALISGDVTHDYTQEQAQHAHQILAKLKCKYFIVPGNHDDRDILAKVFGEGPCPRNADGFINYTIEEYPLRLIALDSVDTGKPGGKLCTTRLNWLSSRLEQGADRPTVIFMHHPPLKLGVPETDDDGFSGAEQLGEILKAYSNIEAIMCGHIHLVTTTRWSGTIVKTAPSTGMQLQLDLKQKEESKFLLSDPAFLLHHWTSEKSLVTHTYEIKQLPGPFEFC